MKLTNYQIFEYTQRLAGLFEKEDVYIPAKANFLIQKNIRTIMVAGEEIEKARFKIASHYGNLDSEQNIFIVPPEAIDIANKEINDLFTIEQDLDIKTFQLEALGQTELTAKQMQALMFMIEE